MRLNTLKPAGGAKTARRRIGRGQGSGKGGTAGRGHKGQKSRSGGYHKVGFEGGQMPLQRRLPKRGFRSMGKQHFAELRLNELGKVEGEIVDIQSLQKAGVIGLHITCAKAILSGEITRAVTLRGISASKGARAAIEKAGGSVEQVEQAKGAKSEKKSTGKAEAKAKAKVKVDANANANANANTNTNANANANANAQGDSGKADAGQGGKPDKEAESKEAEAKAEASAQEGQGKQGKPDEVGESAQAEQASESAEEK